MDSMSTPLSLTEDQKQALLAANEKAQAALTYCKRLRDAGIPLPEEETRAEQLSNLTGRLVNALVVGQRPRRR